MALGTGLASAGVVSVAMMAERIGEPEAASPAADPASRWGEVAKQFAIPMLGLGTAAMGDTDVVERSVLHALEAGYRHIDTALLYESHAGIAGALQKSDVAAEEVFLTTKVGFFPAGDPPPLLGYPVALHYRPENTKGRERDGCLLSLQQLGVPRVNLLLVHNPATTWLEIWAGYLPHLSGLLRQWPRALTDVLSAFGAFVCRHIWRGGAAGFADRRRSWLAMEQLLAEGKTEAIGVSNYTVEQLEEMKQYATVMPKVNQIELHPLFPREELVRYCHANGIAVTAYGHHVALDALEALPAEDLDFTAASPLLLKWIVDRGVSVIPRSCNPQHMAENAQIFGWTLSPLQTASLAAIGTDLPYYWDPTVVPARA